MSKSNNKLSLEKFRKNMIKICLIVNPLILLPAAVVAKPFSALVFSFFASFMFGLILICLLVLVLIVVK